LSGRYPKTGSGRINTYAVFAENARAVVHASGRCGLVLPTGIATDANTAAFFRDLVARLKLASLYDFENMKPIFSGVHRSYRFCLFTMAGDAIAIRQSAFAFFMHDVSEMPRATFPLSPEEIFFVNPNTGTTPLFRFRRDAEITIGIYNGRSWATQQIPSDGAHNDRGMRAATACNSNTRETADVRPCLGHSP